jgi:Fur family ferric uptake transcriptional regulator
MSKAEILLKQRNLKKTEGRLAVLDVLMGSKNLGLSEQDIEQQLNTSMDRVTIYRTLSTFLKEHLVHKIADDEGVIRYALCGVCQHSQTQHHNHHHIHFKCDVCKTTQCLTQNPVSVVDIPAGYTFRDSSFLIMGICKQCNR